MRPFARRPGRRWSRPFVRLPRVPGPWRIRSSSCFLRLFLCPPLPSPCGCGRPARPPSPGRWRRGRRGARPGRRPRARSFPAPSSRPRESTTTKVIRRWSGRCSAAWARSASDRSTPRNSRTAEAKAVAKGGRRGAAPVVGAWLPAGGVPPGAPWAGVVAASWGSAVAGPRGRSARAAPRAFPPAPERGRSARAAPVDAPHRARRSIAADREAGSSRSSARVGAARSRAGATPDGLSANHCAMREAASGAGASRRRFALGRARIVPVISSSTIPGTSQSAPSSLTRARASTGTRTLTPSRGDPGENS